MTATQRCLVVDAVTVTYGDRAASCIRVAEAALVSGARAVVVVDNGSLPASREALRQWCRQTSGQAQLVQMPGNTGSAGGFSAGIDAALDQSDVDLVWLLDDDTVADSRALDFLLEYRARLPVHQRDLVALLSLRPERKRLAAMASGTPWQRVYPTRGSFLEIDLPAMLGHAARNLVHSRMAPADPLGRRGALRLPYAPYGGLLLSRALLDEVGRPSQSLRLYEDDTEFTHRLTARGREIHLVPASLLRDVEPSWYDASPGRSFFTKLLGTPESTRVYFSVRNRVFFERTAWCRPGVRRSLNEFLVMQSLRIVAASTRRREAYRLVAAAVAEGRAMSPAARGAPCLPPTDRSHRSLRPETNDMRVTIGLPFGNNAATLGDAIASVFAQTCEDWELILIDDGSTDGSLTLARSVRDRRVRVITDGRHLGLPARLNQLAQLATTHWLARMDADDIMHPHRLVEQIQTAKHTGAHLVASNAFSIDQHNEVYGRQRLYDGAIEGPALLRNDVVIHPTVLGETRWFQSFAYDETFSRAQDKELWLRTARHTRIARVPEPLLFYRDAGNFQLDRYRATCEYDRRLLWTYGPCLIGRRRAATMVARSYGKQSLYTIASALHVADAIVNTRSADISDDERVVAQTLLDAVLTTAVPGLRDRSRNDTSLSGKRNAS